MLQDSRNESRIGGCRNASRQPARLRPAAAPRRQVSSSARLDQAVALAPEPAVGLDQDLRRAGQHLLRRDVADDGVAPPLPELELARGAHHGWLARLSPALRSCDPARGVADPDPLLALSGTPIKLLPMPQLIVVGLLGVYGNALYRRRFRQAAETAARHDGDYQIQLAALAAAGGTDAARCCDDRGMSAEHWPHFASLVAIRRLAARRASTTSGVGSAVLVWGWRCAQHPLTLQQRERRPAGRGSGQGSPRRSRWRERSGIALGAVLEAGVT